MTTQEKIEVMQAYARGEAIEVSDKGADNWSEIKCPLWDWNSFEYRVEPKYGKFKIGDKILYKDEEVWPLITDRIYTYGTSANDFLNDDKFIKFDDVLWYWEYQDKDGFWHKTDYRATRAEIEKLSNFHNFNPLYALGFRLSQNIKDEK